MKPCELTYTVTTISNMIATKFSQDELPLVAAIFTQIGDTLATYAAQNEICNSKSGKQDA